MNRDDVQPPSEIGSLKTYYVLLINQTFPNQWTRALLVFQIIFIGDYVEI